MAQGSTAHIPLEHPYPVINQQPTMGAVIRNFTAGDYGQFLTGTLIGGVFGFAAGGRVRASGAPAQCSDARAARAATDARCEIPTAARRRASCTRSLFCACPTPPPPSLLPVAGKPVRRQGSLFLASTAALLCFTQSFRSSYHRLTGQRPNEVECARAGVPYVITPP